MNQKDSSLICRISIPAYDVKSLGSRHILVGGGGGSALTGVKNEIELFLLTYNSLEEIPNTFKSNLNAKKTGCINTSKYANMNIDVLSLGAQDDGRYVLVSGQDEFCAIYLSNGFSVNTNENKELEEGLSIDFKKIGSIKTDFKSTDSYQKCVRVFYSDPANSNLRLVTGGMDGYVRLWDLSKFLTENLNNHHENEISSANFEHLREFHVQQELDALDVSKCGTILATINSKETLLWDLTTGKQLLTLQEIPQLQNNFKVRTLRFLSLDKSGLNCIFIVAHNTRARSTAKQIAYLSLWAYNKTNKNCHLISFKKACNDSISCLATTPCGNFIGIGTMEGSILIFSTHKLDTPLIALSKVHASFVTAVEFLPKRSYDGRDLGRIQSSGDNQATCFLPGVCSADSQIALVSLSVDQTLRVTKVPYSVPTALSSQLLKWAFMSCALYLFLCFKHTHFIEMSIQRRAFGNLKNNFTPIIPIQSKDLNSTQNGKELTSKQRLNLDTPLSKTAAFSKPTKRPTNPANDPDLRCTYLPFKDNFEDVVLAERLQMENFKVLEDDDFRIIKKDKSVESKKENDDASEYLEGSSGLDEYSDDSDTEDDSLSNIFADLQGEEFRFLADKPIKKC